MSDVIIIGDGPAGLSAALFLAKREKKVTVIGPNKTPVHRAFFWNYPGIDEIDGPDLIAVQRRQAEKFGATLVDAEATAIERNADGFVVTDSTGNSHKAPYVIYAAGRARDLAVQLGAATNADGTIRVDHNGRTSIANFYAAGWTTRKDKIQAIISAGEAAAAALDILSREAGRDLHDFDVRPEN